MLKADLNNFQRLSSLFYLMFRILIKQLQICKYTSKNVYSREKMYTTLYLKLTKRSSRWCKMSYRHLKLSRKKSSRLVISSCNINQVIRAVLVFFHDKVSQASGSTKSTKSIKTQPSKITKIKMRLKTSKWKKVCLLSLEQFRFYPVSLNQ